MTGKDVKSNQVEAPLTPVDNQQLRDAIIDAISSYPLSETEAWVDLDELSSHTEVGAIEANNEGIFTTGNNKFEATATVYVTLNYGDKKDSFSTTDSFPAHVVGTVKDGNRISIENFSVDTSSFFDDGDDDEILKSAS